VFFLFFFCNIIRIGHSNLNVNKLTLY